MMENDKYLTRSSAKIVNPAVRQKPKYCRHTAGLQDCSTEVGPHVYSHSEKSFPNLVDTAKFHKRTGEPPD